MFGYNADKGYNELVDIWSIGCVILQTLTGKTNIWDWMLDSEDFAWKMVMYPEAPNYPNNLDDDLRDFLNCCFKIKFEERSSAAALLKHRYLQEYKKNQSIQQT